MGAGGLVRQSLALAEVLPNFVEDGARGGTILDANGDSPPGYAAIAADEKMRWQGDVVALFAAAGMKHSVAADDGGVHVTQERKMQDVAANDLARPLRRVDGDCQKPATEPGQLLLHRSEPAEL
jgi:hypothetical protein